MDCVFDSPFYESSMDESLAMAPFDHLPVALLDSATHILHCNPHVRVCYSLFEAAAAAGLVVIEVTVEIVAEQRWLLPEG